MKTVLKSSLSVLTALMLVLSLSACGKGSLAKFEKLFNEKMAPAYESFLATEDGEDAPSPTLAGYIATDTYLNNLFAYVAEGKKPDNGTITEQDGVYICKFNEVTQEISFSKETDSIKVIQKLEFGEETQTDLITVFSSANGKYYVQSISPVFGEYTEIEYDANGGSYVVKQYDEASTPDIFTDGIPAGFAKGE